MFPEEKLKERHITLLILSMSRHLVAHSAAHSLYGDTTVLCMGTDTQYFSVFSLFLIIEIMFGYT
jgi:hypothetical protein